MSLKFFQVIRFLKFLTIYHNSPEWDSHLRLECLRDSILEGLLSLDLLIEDPKCDILEVGDGRDLLIKDDLLSHNIDQIPILRILSLLISLNLVLDHLCKCSFSSFVEHREFILAILGHNRVDLARLLLLKSIYQ